MSKQPSGMGSGAKISEAQKSLLRDTESLQICTFRMYYMDKISFSDKITCAFSVNNTIKLHIKHVNHVYNLASLHREQSPDSGSRKTLIVHPKDAMANL